MAQGRSHYSEADSPMLERRWLSRAIVRGVFGVELAGWSGMSSVSGR